MPADADRIRKLAAPVLCVALAACAGPQSSLDPAGEAAERVAGLFWQMLAGSAVIWCAVIATAIHAGRKGRRPWSEGNGLTLILWAGALVPTAVLAALLVHGLRLMPELRASGGDLRIHVVGQQFWWRVAYQREGHPDVVSANEIRLPAGATVEVVLDSPDVIHSFWIPSLAGKTDMIPGRTNRQMLKPTRPGVYRGACAEFCGSGHALMAMSAVVMEPAAFEEWLLAEGEPAQASAARGQEIFHVNGCAACHTVRGTEAAGMVGPDLTHVGSRHSIGAGILANTTENRAYFIARSQTIKPGVRMPSYDMLSDQDLLDLATWLGELR